MSYIHDALKKAQREKDTLAGKCTNIWSNVRLGDSIFYRTWLAPVCVISLALVFSSYTWIHSLDDLASDRDLHVALPLRNSAPRPEPSRTPRPAPRAVPRPAPQPAQRSTPRTALQSRPAPKPAPQLPASEPMTVQPRRTQIPQRSPVANRSPVPNAAAKKTTETKVAEKPEATPVPPPSKRARPTPSPNPPPANAPAPPSSPGPAVSLYDQALRFQKEGRLEEARTLYEAALRKAPTLVSALNNLGAVYIQQNNYDEARRYLEKAVRVDPSYADAYYNLACLHARKNDLSRGIFYLKKSIAINPAARRWARQDPDLQNLRNHAEYEEIINDGQTS